MYKIIDLEGVIDKKLKESRFNYDESDDDIKDKLLEYIKKQYNMELSFNYTDQKIDNMKCYTLPSSGE